MALTIDPELLAAAQRIGGHRTQEATVKAALEEYIERRQQRRILDLFGTIDYAPDHDYKKQRRHP